MGVMRRRRLTIRAHVSMTVLVPEDESDEDVESEIEDKLGMDCSPDGWFVEDCSPEGVDIDDEDIEESVTCDSCEAEIHQEPVEYGGKVLCSACLYNAHRKMQKEIQSQ